MSDNPYANPAGGYGAQTTRTAGEPQTAGAGGAQPSVILDNFGDTARRPAPAGAPASGGAASGDLIKETTTAGFSADVIQESRNQPVIVDFWAPWCGPCKQLTPMLEQAVRAAGGKVRLVTMNIDEHPSIAGQLGVQSIPAVFAFFQGQPVDGFMGAVAESELKSFIDRLVQTADKAGGGAGQGDDPIAAALDQAKELAASGQLQQAAQLFGAILEREPTHRGATAGLADMYVEAGQAEQAKQLLDQLALNDPEAESDAAIQGLRTRLRLAAEIAELGDAAELQRRLDADPADLQARYDLALIAQAKGDRQASADHLLEIIRRDREFRDDGARVKLLEFFEAWGPQDPATKDARRKLSTVLFS